MMTSFDGFDWKYTATREVQKRPDVASLVGGSYFIDIEETMGRR